MPLLNKIGFRLIIILIIIAVVWFGYQKFFAPKELPFDLVEVKRGDVSQEISETGVVKAAEDIDLSFRRSGKIERVFVKVGDKVKENQELIRLETRDLNIQLSEAQAALDLANARLNQLLAGSTPEEIRLAETHVVNAETALDSAKAAEANKQIALQNAEQNLEDVEEKAASDLAQLYDDVPDILNDARAKANDAINTKIDDLFLNDNTQIPSLTFDSNNTQAKNDAVFKRVASTEALEELEGIINQLGASQAERDTALANAKQNLNTIRSLLLTLGDALNSALGISSTTLNTYKTNVNTALTNINTAISNINSQEQLISSQKVTSSGNINNAKTSRDSAKANLEAAQNAVLAAEGDLQAAKDQLSLKKAGPRKEDIDIYEAQIKDAKAKVNLIQEQITQSSLKSPTEGVAIKVNKKVGETTQVTDVVISLISVRQFQIEVDIYEEDIPKIEVGDPVDIELVAFSGETLKGSVLSIDPAEKIIDGVVYYEVTIGFEEEKEGIRSGMTADIVVETDSRENVLAISKNAIQERNGKAMVEVLENGVIIKREITLGLEGSNDLVEVLSGLEEGDEMILR